MTDSYETSMGGASRRFQTTSWFEIQNAGTYDQAQQRIILDDLIRDYWKPVYCYLRCKGSDNDSAKDLTQGFFHEIVLGRDLVHRADQSKGRFRTFLLKALDRYVISEHRRETAARRLPVRQIVESYAVELPSLLWVQSRTDPEQIFNYAWASEILRQVLSEVEHNCYADDKVTHWQVFRARVVEPILNNVKPPALRELCELYDIENEAKASDMIFSIKGQFRVVMRRHLRRFVESDSEVEEEFNEILRTLSERPAQ